MTRRKTIGFIAVILLFGFALRVPYFFHTMQDIDEGEHAAVASILMDGGLPYLNAVENKPPGIFYIYLATFYLFGKYNMTAVHMLTFFWTLATGVLLGILAKKLSGKSAALLALLFYLTFTTALYPKMIAANCEIFMALPYSLAVLLLWYACVREKGYLFFVSGFMSGLALLIKQVAGVQVVAIAVYLVVLIPLLYGKKRIVPSIVACAKYWAGFVLPVGAVIFLFYKKGILADQIFWSITEPRRYISLGVSSQGFMSQILAEFVPFVLSTVILWVLSCIWMKRVAADLRNQRKSFPSQFSLFLVLWLVTGIYAAFLGNRMYGHYFIQILPPLSLMAALAAGKYVDEKSESRSRYGKAAILALTVIPGIVFAGMAISYEATTDTWGGMRPDFRPATEYIKKHTGPADKIFVWGWFTPIYVYSERTPSTRFVTANKNVGYKQGNDPNERDRADITWLAVPEAWPMLEADLKRDPPELIVDTSPGNYHDFGRYPLRDYPILRGFVDQNCRLETKIGGTDIYRCGDSSAQ
jgi:4-amino-4-deoxy-L-arabinose transferase-like glycosyltransferase